jgi:tRNA U34 2-thiouridine synthase MnmA/TrmU
MGGQADPILKVKAISLFSGGLDSILAVKLIQEQEIDIEGVTFETPFFNAAKAQISAKIIGLSLTIINITHRHLDMLKAPRYGYGKNMNPCIDCHALMLKMAGKRMEEAEADFIFTGEVLGQRPMSQTKQSLHVVAKNSGYADVILRPLSAQLLPEIKPEQEKIVDRLKLLAIQGRGRKAQMELARHYDIKDYPPPAGGCLLTDPNFSKRLKDLFDHCPDHDIRDIELLKFGRHFRIHATSKVIVGRNQTDNAAIQALIQDTDITLYMADCPGPTVLVPYGCDDKTLLAAASLCCLYSDALNDQPCNIICKTGEIVRSAIVSSALREDADRMLI